MAMQIIAPEGLLTPAEVAEVFKVDPRTVTHWANSGRLKSVLTLGGHRRFRAADVLAFRGEIPAPNRPA